MNAGTHTRVTTLVLSPATATVETTTFGAFAGAGNLNALAAPEPAARAAGAEAAAR